MAFYTDEILSYKRSFWENHWLLFNFMSVYFKSAAVIYIFAITFFKPYKRLFSYLIDVNYYSDRITLKSKYINREIYLKEVRSVTYTPIKISKCSLSRSDHNRYTVGFALKICLSDNKRLSLFTPSDAYYPAFIFSDFYHLYKSLGGNVGFSFTKNLIFPSFSENDRLIRENIYKTEEPKKIKLSAQKTFPNPLFLGIWAASLTLCAVLFARKSTHLFSNNYIDHTLNFVFMVILILLFIISMIKPYLFVWHKKSTLAFEFFENEISIEFHKKNSRYFYSQIKSAYVFEKENTFKHKANYICLRINFNNGRYKDFILNKCVYSDNVQNTNSEKLNSYKTAELINSKCGFYKVQ